MIGVSLNNYLSIYKAIIDFRFAIKQVDDICFSHIFFTPRHITTKINFINISKQGLSIA